MSAYSCKSHNIEGFRPVSVIEDDGSFIIRQGNTSAKSKIQSHGRFTELKFVVASLADRINYQAYRGYSRRHFEIQRFLTIGYQLINPSYSVTTTILTTDGSSRCTALNTLTKLFKSKEHCNLPVAISFGKHNEELVYDLNYLQDSQGSADCAVMFLSTNSPVITAILYEGVLSVSEFVTGLENSLIYCFKFIIQI